MSTQHKDNLTVFWLLNLINALCAGMVILTAFLNFAAQGPSEVFHIGVFAIFEATLSFVLNLMLYRYNEKERKNNA